MQPRDPGRPHNLWDAPPGDPGVALGAEEDAELFGELRGGVGGPGSWHRLDNSKRF